MWRITERVSTDTSGGKGRNCTILEKQGRKPDYSWLGEGWGTQLFAYLHSQLLLPNLPSNRMSRKGLEELRSTYCVRSDSRVSEETECGKCPWDLMRCILRELAYELAKTRHYRRHLKSHSIQAKSSVTGKGKTQHSFFKRVKKEYLQGATDEHHLCVWQYPRADPPGKHATAYGKLKA